MNKAYDRRYFFFLGFLIFLGFLGFLGTQEYRHLSALAAPACIASLAALVFIPRSVEQIPRSFRLNSYRDIFRAMAGQI